MQDRGKNIGEESNEARLKPLTLRGLSAYAVAGLISGTVLGLMLKIMQGFSGHRVYRLLLNADYVPLLNRFRLGEAAEFVIHLLISAVLCLILGLIWQRRAARREPSAREMASVTALIGLLIGALLYPTTLLSAVLSAQEKRF